MLVNEVLRRISFKIGTPDDITGRAVNPIISNRYIVDELNSQLRQYANVTKGIMDVYSFPLAVDTPFVAAPSLALRSQPYFYINIISNGVMFPADMRGASEVFPRFRMNPVKGISNWVMPWSEGKQQYFSFYPTNNVGSLGTTLTSDISDTVTTIPVASTTGFIANHGRITIESEKILYRYKDSTNFYGCVRGVENTDAVVHTKTDAVSENNVIVFYSRLAEPITVKDDNIVEEAILDREIEVTEEHMEGIIKMTAYNLLVKIDPERAAVYKADGDELYRQYEVDIRRGYYRGRQGTNVRQPWPGNESGMPYGTNLIGY